MCAVQRRVVMCILALAYRAAEIFSSEERWREKELTGRRCEEEWLLLCRCASYTLIPLPLPFAVWRIFYCYSISRPNLSPSLTTFYARTTPCSRCITHAQSARCWVVHCKEKRPTDEKGRKRKKPVPSVECGSSLSVLSHSNL